MFLKKSLMSIPNFNKRNAINNVDPGTKIANILRISYSRFTISFHDIKRSILFFMIMIFRNHNELKSKSCFEIL